MLPSPVSLRSLRQELLSRAELQGDAFCTAFSAAADQWLAGLLTQATAGDPEDVALVAVGGYGRGELCPYSDLDVVLVYRGRRDIKKVADAVWYPVWDEGIRLDHSVRRPSEVLEVAKEDLRAQLGLLDGRVVAGDASVAEPMLARALDQWRALAGEWLPVLAAQVDERHRAHGDVAFLLEPDLKEAHGGLRDFHAVRSAALAVPAVAEQVDLHSLSEPRATLTAARVELHRSTNRATDRLLLQEQDQVAAALGIEDADALMASIAEAGRTVAWVTDDVWRRRSSWPVSQPRRRWRSSRGPAPSADDGEVTLVPIEPGIALRQVTGHSGEGEVVLEPGTDPLGEPALALRVAAVAAEHGLPINRASLDLLADADALSPDPWPEAMRSALVRVLATGAAAIPALEALDQKGLFIGLLPEWAEVRNRPQRNAYHRFTVDRHLLEAASQAAPLAATVQRPDLLLVGALLHDIGKGFPGDHTDAGVIVVETIGRRMGFAPDDVMILVGLVRNHLLLADAATRRDLDDPLTIEGVAAAVNDRLQLDLLAALTEADSLATGPAAWGQWKAGLVADLTRRVAAYLSGGGVPPTEPLVTDRHRGFMRQVERLGRSVVAADLPNVTVVARDRPGLLSAVTGVFALRGLDVRSADIAGEEGFAVETFVVEPSRSRWPDFELVADQLEAVLRGTFPLEERLAEQVRAYAEGRRPVSSQPAEVRITIDNAASMDSTVVDVRAEDDIGLLHRITAALFALELDVVTARVSTLGHEVLDAFYVRDATTGGKVTRVEHIESIKASISRAINVSTTDAEHR